MNVKFIESSGIDVTARANILLATLLCVGAAGMARAADHSVSAATGKFDCAAVNPGDTITLAGGSRGPLTVSSCNGTSSKPIVIRNDPSAKGPAVLEFGAGSSGGFVLVCADCVWTTIDGSARWQGAPTKSAYGIKVTSAGGSPTAFVKVSGLSKFVVIRSVEVDGRWPSLTSNGIGISVNDHALDPTAYPGQWTEGMVIEDSYVHDVEGEGIYVGPNWGKGGLPLRNIKIRRNLVEDVGWDGINLKSSIGGGSEVHHNVIRRSGKRVDTEAGQHYGIGLFEGGARIYNNWIEDAGETGISHYLQNLPASYGAQQVEIFNNVVVNPGLTGPLEGNGISSAGRDGAAFPVPTIYSNTVVGAEGYGIKVGSTASSGLIRDNIVVDSGKSPIASASTVQVANNLTGASERMGFENATGKNFRLLSTSPARNNGSAVHPATDYDDVPRPQEGKADQGAFEYGDADQAPNPPAQVVVE